MTRGAKRVLVLGAGAQGNVVGWILARAAEVSTLALADLDPRRAADVAANIGDGIVVEPADARDRAGLVALFRRGAYDLVVNTAVPDFIPIVMRAALEAGIDYLDLTSLLLHERPGVAIEQMEDEREWAASGRTALVNGGSAPGLTNVMARDAVDRLDEIEAIRIRDYSVVTCDALVTLWSPKVFLVDCITPPLVWDGGPRRAPIFSGAEDYDFPAPVARRGRIYLHAHEEPATLPLYVGKPVPYCDYKIGEPDIESWRFVVERLGLMSEEPVVIDGHSVRPRDLLLRLMPPTLAPRKVVELVAAGRLDGCTLVTSEVTGRTGGRRVRATHWTESPTMRDACAVVPGAADISLLTSVPAATFALMLLRGQLGRSGVVLPETLDPDARAIFRREIARFGIHLRSRVESLD